MRSILAILAFTLLSFALAASAQAEGPATSGYKILKEWSIGGDTKWDYLTLDSDHRRLYIARASHVSVLDADSGEVVADIPNTNGVHGVALAPEQGFGFTSNGKDNTVTRFDLKTFKAVDTVAVGQKPDAIIYDSGSGHIFVMNGKSDDATVIDPATGKVIGTVALGGAPEFAASDGKGKVFINLEDKGEVAVVDSKELKVLQRWPLTPAHTPTGIAIDLEHHRLFVGCRSQVMVILDSETGKVLASLPIGAGVDATAYDPATGLAFASNADGTLNIIGENTPGKFVVMDNLPTVKGSRTMALDPKTHNVYLAANQPLAGGKAGGFAVLIVGK